jgi:hypothetical protein
VAQENTDYVNQTVDDLRPIDKMMCLRVLADLKKPDRDRARRTLHYLAAAIRPLTVDELAKVCAIDVEDPTGIPKLKPGWRCEDQEQGFLALLSDLITID